MQNKRGQGLSTGAIILIILGVLVLVILALGFLLGWDKLFPWVDQGDNVDTIVQACNKACATMSSYDYCSRPRELKATDLPPPADQEGSKTANCSWFANETAAPDYQKYGIPECPSITC